jgi:hypothetical protein
MVYTPQNANFIGTQKRLSHGILVPRQTQLPRCWRKLCADLNVKENLMKLTSLGALWEAHGWM